MNTMYNKYINKHGNFSHNLDIEIDEGLSENEKNTILYDIFNLIGEKYINKHILNTYIGIKWGFTTTPIYYIIILTVKVFLLIEQFMSIQSYY